MPYIGTCFRFYTQMRVQKQNKAFAYRIYSHFTQQCSHFCTNCIQSLTSFGIGENILNQIILRPKILLLDKTNSLNKTVAILWRGLISLVCIYDLIQIHKFFFRAMVENMLYWETDDIGATLKPKTFTQLYFFCTIVRLKDRPLTHSEVEFN